MNPPNPAHNVNTIGGAARHVARLDPNMVRNHFGLGPGRNCFESNYLYPRVAFCIDTTTPIWQVHWAQHNGVAENYHSMNQAVTQRNWTGPLTAPVPGPPVLRHAFRVMCATLYDGISWTNNGSFRRGVSLPIELGNFRNRVARFNGHTTTQNFTTCLKYG